ncbi:SGNH hydrolase-type esterase domain-containing protein [Mycena filopes]|nr:SGNH hydrolase-type esterase domain-containing protein [Mycena filopes]
MLSASLSPDGRPHTPPPNLHPIPWPALTLSSRWQLCDNGAICSAWASSSIKFYSRNPVSDLWIKIGGRTERKDCWNGGTPMLAVSVANRANSIVQTKTKTIDVAPNTVIRLCDEPTEDCLVEVVLVDWATTLEIDAFLTSSTDAQGIAPDPPESTQILFIGDSISCGLALEASDGGEPIPRGVLDAFPAQAVAILREKYLYPLSLEVVAYPGISLADTTSGAEDQSISGGMITRFFHSSPWETAPQTLSGNPKLICIALGTNDEAADVSPDVFRKTLDKFIRRLATTFPGASRFYIIPPFRDFADPDAGAIARDLISHPIIVTVDGLDLDVQTCGDLYSGMTRELTVDGLHPTLAGHTQLARNLAEFLVGQRTNLGG